MKEIDQILQSQLNDLNSKALTRAKESLKLLKSQKFM